MTRKPSRRSILILIVLTGLSLTPVCADEQRSLDAISDWVGLDLPEALRRFGSPSAVYPLRGLEAWQDDVVFVWPEFELFWFENRVWQVRFFSLGDIPRGAPSSVVKTLLGEPLFDYGTSWIYQRGGKAWPLRLRVDFSPAESVSSPAIPPDPSEPAVPSQDRAETPGALKAFYLYRADF